MKALVLVSLLVAACTTTDNAPVVTDTVTCTKPVVTQVAAGNNPTCTVGAGTCGDGNSYVLTCTEFAPNLQCNCVIDAVSKNSDGIEIVSSCAAAGQLSNSQIERAWLDCGVDMTFPTAGSGSAH